MLDASLLVAEDIQRRQDMVRWLAAAHEERIHIMASALPLCRVSEGLDQLVMLIRDIAAHPHPQASLIIRLWSLLSGPAMGYALLKVLLGEFVWAQAPMSLPSSLDTSCRYCANLPQAGIEILKFLSSEKYCSKS